jgi:hypothetical protein
MLLSGDSLIVSTSMVERNLADPIYLGSREARKFWNQEYDDLKALLTDLGLTK